MCTGSLFTDQRPTRQRGRGWVAAGLGPRDCEDDDSGFCVPPGACGARCCLPSGARTAVEAERRQCGQIQFHGPKLTRSQQVSSECSLAKPARSAPSHSCGVRASSPPSGPHPRRDRVSSAPAASANHLSTSPPPPAPHAEAPCH